jgi:3-hydroxybutyryl-CoA dehydrogenase
VKALPELVGVYGGGRMGVGIAHAFLVAGSDVIVVEANTAAAEAAFEALTTSVKRSADLGVLKEDIDTVLARVEISAAPDRMAKADLVIEAVPEDPDLKRQILESVEVIAPAAVLATNTSSLSIAALGEGLRYPEKFIGLHFFNPVPASSLVELVTCVKTAPELISRAQSWIISLGKTAITVTDSPGFASSRLGVALALEAIRMVESGVASVDDIDTAMTLGYRHPVGPLRTTDIVGLDVRLAIAEHLEREIGAQFAPPELLRAKVAAGELGRKAGRGFFDW